MKRLLYLLVSVSLLTTLSCRKLDDIYIEKTDTENIKNNEYPETFQWSTLQTVDLKISGFPGLPAMYKTLSVESTLGAVYLKKLVNISENHQVTIQIPATESTIVVKCGKLWFSVPVTDGAATCSLQTGNPDD